MRRRLFIALFIVASIGLVAGYAYRYRGDSMSACVSDCVARCVR